MYVAERRRGLLRHLTLVGVGAGITAWLGASSTRTSAAQTQTGFAQPGPIDPLQPLRALFEFHVRRRPSVGLDLNGVIMLQADATGALVPRPAC
jgi:hypothetical protein